MPPLTAKMPSSVAPEEETFAKVKLWIALVPRPKAERFKSISYI